MRMDNLDFVFLDQRTQRSDQTQVQWPPAVQPEKRNTRMRKFCFKIATSHCHERQIEVIRSGITTNIEHEHLGSAAIQRIEDVHDFHHLKGHTFLWADASWAASYNIE